MATEPKLRGERVLFDDGVAAVDEEVSGSCKGDRSPLLFS